ncbi:DNA polymerase/3'-5' exonuclease PolX [Sediminitomix flava]|uniref:DNA polymerase (Family 10) n=1 Tax=Sediminitomix flava TaxID=379075 RepID=A0A315ZA06_SEDFL|nr:DNA polymerase/3'-5' exonuclease PolX [Sediminitomix flava]PWJ40910.1 DNA polymerase (family 10) [Sediminitomix flava]
MTNKDIAKVLKSAVSLMEVHGANPFKTRAYSSAVYGIENSSESIAELDNDGLLKAGYSKSMAEKILSIVQSGSFDEYDKLVADTPSGVVDMLEIKGIGGKKIGKLWKELGLESLDALKTACENKEVEKLKGFGAKTQATILDQIAFLNSNVGKLHYAEAEPFAVHLLNTLEKLPSIQKVAQTGEVRRYMEVVETLQYVVVASDRTEAKKAIAEIEGLNYDEKTSGPLTWRGILDGNMLSVEIFFVEAKSFGNEVLKHSASGAHLANEVKEGVTLFKFLQTNFFETEEEIYKALELPYFPAELREGIYEIEAKEKGLPTLVEMSDLKGILHNHSTYSDGKHSLEEMATYCKDLGYEYLGISDHSVSAFYANGLDEERVKAQQEEIDELNQKLAPFKIFKGIESDILNDGKLDYSDEVLASFDFIVASIHSNLKMDKAKATQRLLTAIANPYTTILGHPTGRLLLKREGYPIDHGKIIDACAEHNVMIEINANPWRLDLDWRWVKYALDKGVKIAINPDAHEMNGYHHMKYGLLVGRKAGLTKEMTLNALSLEEIDKVFSEKRTQAK